MASEHDKDRRRAWAERIRAGAPVRIDVYSGGRSVHVASFADGAIVAREHGGPIYDHGFCTNAKSPTVRAWRMAPDPALHARALELLLSAGFPELPMAPLIPDEHPSSITLHDDATGESATALLPGRAVRESAALAELAGAFDAIAYATQRMPHTEDLPNPDLQLWR